MKKAIVLSLGLALVGSTAWAAVKSGLQEGERPAPYFVRDITGPQAGESLCYRCKYGNEPVVNLFTRSLDERTVSLIKQIDAKVGEKEGLRAFVTLLSDDADAAGKQLKELAKKQGIENVPLTVFEGAAGPPQYKIHKDADVTVMMWVNSEVKANHAYEKGSMCSECVKTIVADIPKIVK